MGHPGVALRDLEASRDALSRGRYQPQPTERRLSCSHRVTFVTGANRDFPNWRRQSCSAARGSVLPNNRQRLTAVSLGPRIRRVGLDTPVLTDGAAGIIAGHGRIEAAKLIGMSDVPTVHVDHLTSAQIRAYVIADNKLAENAGWDRALLALELQELSVELNFDVTVTDSSVARR